MIEPGKALVYTCSCGHRMEVAEHQFGLQRQCSKCDAVYVVNPDDCDMVDRPRPSPPAGPDHCARCGRRFRGDWDKAPTDAGVICDICARQAYGGHVPHKPRSETPSIDHVVDEVNEAERARELSEPVEMTWNRKLLLALDPESATFRLGVLALAIGVLLVTGYYLFIADLDPAPTQAAPTAEAEALTPRDLPLFATVVVYATAGILAWLSHALALFVVFAGGGSSGSRRNDLITALIFGAVLWGISVLFGIGTAVAGVLPGMAGMALATALWGIHIYVVYELLSHYFSLGFIDVILFFIIRTLLVFGLKAIQTLVVGLLANVLL